MVSNLFPGVGYPGGFPPRPAYMGRLAFLPAMVADGILENTGRGIVPGFPTTRTRFALRKPPSRGGVVTALMAIAAPFILNQSR